jgi:hypothetical protein
MKEEKASERVDMLGNWLMAWQAVGGHSQGGRVAFLELTSILL